MGVVAFGPIGNSLVLMSIGLGIMKYSLFFEILFNKNILDFDPDSYLNQIVVIKEPVLTNL